MQPAPEHQPASLGMERPRPQHTMPKAYSRGSVPLGSLFGVPIRLHLLYFAALLLAVVVSWASGTGYNVGWAVCIFGPVLLVTVLIHELGHCLASRQVGAEVHGILLWPLGGLAFLGQAKSPARDLWVALAGPLTHIPQFFVWYFITLISRRVVYGRTVPTLAVENPNNHFWLSVASAAAQLQLWVMCFNLLLPAYPLDGGRIFADLLLICRVPVELTAKLTLGLALLITAALFAYGCYRVSVLLIVVSLWMLLSSIDLGRAILNGTVRQHPMFCYEDEPRSMAPPPPPPGPFPPYPQQGRAGPRAGPGTGPSEQILPPTMPRSAPV